MSACMAFCHVKKVVRIISCFYALLNFLRNKKRGERKFFSSDTTRCRSNKDLEDQEDQEDLNGIANDWFSLQSGLPEDHNNMADEELILKVETRYNRKATLSRYPSLFEETVGIQ
jgi:hypothetical protein